MIYIDIGPGKTGTTALQHFLFANKQEIADQGFEYSTYHQSHNCVGFSTSYAGWKGKSQSDAVEYAEYIEKLCKQTTLIISSEHFGIFCDRPFSDFSDFTESRIKRRKNIASLRKHLGNSEVTVCSYLRRQDEMLISNYNQMVKGGLYSSKVEDIKNTRLLLDYQAMIEDWEELIHPSNVIVKPYNKSKLSGGNVIVDFCGELKIDISNASHPAELFSNKNPRLSPEFLEVKRLYNMYSDNIPGCVRQSFIKASESLSDRNDRFGIMSSDERQRILDKYEECNKWLSAHFSHDTKYFFYDEKVHIPKMEKVDLNAERCVELMSMVLKNISRA